MPQPDPKHVHTDQVLNNVVVSYRQEAESFVAGRVFPEINVSRPSDIYYKFAKGSMYRNDVRPRGPSEESAVTGINKDDISKPSYNCKPKDSLKSGVDPDEMQEHDSIVQMRRRKARQLTSHHLIDRDQNWNNQFFTAGQWSHEETGVASNPGSNEFLQWNDSNSTPIKLIKSAKRTLQLAYGNSPMMELVLVLNPYVVDELEEHPNVTGKLSNDSMRVTTESDLAQIFRVDDVVVAESVHNTAEEGQSESMAFMHGKHALLVARPTEPARETPSSGYIFTVDGYRGTQEGFRTRTWTETEKNETRWTEVDRFESMHMVSPDLGYLFENAVA